MENNSKEIGELLLSNGAEIKDINPPLHYGQPPSKEIGDILIMKKPNSEDQN